MADEVAPDQVSESGFIDAPISAPGGRKLLPTVDGPLRDAYDAASHEVLRRFLAKDLKNARGELVVHIDDARTLADLAGRSAAQAAQKTLKARAHPLHRNGKHPLELAPLDKPEP